MEKIRFINGGFSCELDPEQAMYYLTLTQFRKLFALMGQWNGCNFGAITRCGQFFEARLTDAQDRLAVERKEQERHLEWVACMGSVLRPPFFSEEAKTQAANANRKTKHLAAAVKDTETKITQTTKILTALRKETNYGLPE